jgi:PEP-CTERM motif
MRILAFAAAGTFALLALGGVASASTPLPASNGVAGCVAGGAVVSTDPCSFGGASAFTVGAPFATAEAMATAPPNVGPGANSALTYYFTVDGPDNGPIAIGIATNLLTSADPDNTAFSGISTSQGTHVCADTNEGLCGGSQFDGTLIEMDEPGQVSFIHLEVVASVGIFGGSAFASADPFIFVESTDPNADLYTIRLSDGVANGVAPTPGGVPEPSTWAMLLLGFAGIGLAGYRRAREPRAS